MSYHRRMTRPDGNQAPIVAGLRDAGIEAWVIGEPCDLLTYHRGRWRVLECKPAPEPGIRVKVLAVRTRNDQARQTDFIRAHQVPIVRTVQEALEAVLR
jgi:hypothetical protein